MVIYIRLYIFFLIVGFIRSESAIRVFNHATPPDSIINVNMFIINTSRVCAERSRREGGRERRRKRGRGRGGKEEGTEEERENASLTMISIKDNSLSGVAE